MAPLAASSRKAFAMAIGDAARCGSCRHFRNDWAFLEAATPGLSSLGSALGSARADDGLCLRHDRHRSARAGCADFSPLAPPTPSRDGPSPKHSVMD
jgi:hypothetical protein